jgi:hypothetical protein
MAVIVGGILRIWSPGRIALWRDEVQLVNIASMPSYRHIVSFLYVHESHPPLFYFLAHFLGGLTGDVAGATSALVLVASIALIPAGWWLASLSDIGGAGATSSLLLAVSVTLAYFGVQLRPYALVSLCLVVGMAVLIKATRSSAPGWKLAWALLALCVLYLHHMGVFIVIAEVAALAALILRSCRLAVEARRWLPWIGLVLVLSLPDVWLLLHQLRSAGYAAPKPMSLLLPLEQLVALGLALPGELVLSCAGAVAALRAGLRNAVGDDRNSYGRAVMAASGVASTVLLALLVLASYRSYFLVIQVVMAAVPLGLVATGTFIAHCVDARRNWAGALWIVFAGILLGLSNLFSVGMVKTNTDLVAKYIEAEARSDDFILLVPGATGPSFNRFLRRSLSQIDFPVVGPVRIYPFDQDFERVASPAALDIALDSITAVCTDRRRLWLVLLPYWLRSGSAPARLASDSFGGLGQADRARADFLRRAVIAQFGPPVRVVRAGRVRFGLEQLSLELFVRPPENEWNDSASPCAAR